jgi:hypothetical protein
MPCQRPGVASTARWLEDDLACDPREEDGDSGRTFRDSPSERRSRENANGVEIDLD